MWKNSPYKVFVRWLAVTVATAGVAIGTWVIWEVHYWSKYDALSVVIGTPAPEPYLTRVNTSALPTGDSPHIFPGTPRNQTTRGIHTANGLLPIERLDSSTSCGQSGCHPDITRQWQQSMHHIASFNNPLYKQSVDYTRARQGDEGARWCAGCHDPVLLLSGTMDGNVTEETPGAQAGVTCLVCHSTVGVQDLTGNGRYVLDVPDVSSLDPSYPLSGVVQELLKLYPAPHKAGLMRSLHQEPEFCSSCHRVGLTPAQNHFRWLRGQDQFGGWLNGGPSGRVARGFYTPDAPKRCQDCHMPLVASSDAGNDNGMVRSHAFPGANTAIPTLKNHPDQLAASKAMLEGSVRVDLFAVRITPDAGTENTPDSSPEVWGLPLEQVSLPAGQWVTVDAVVRNVRVGHNFPDGVLDNKDVWLEMTAKNAQGEVLWKQGGLEKNGELNSTSHRYGALLLDAKGNRIDKRNIGDFRVPLLVRTIGPGQSEVVPYRFRVPASTERLTLEAALYYRKTKPDYLAWTYAGERDPASPLPPVGSDTDEGLYLLNPLKEIPTLPVVTVSSARVTLPILPVSTPAREALAQVARADQKASADNKLTVASVPLPQRLNDYGNSWLRYQDLDRMVRAYSLLAALAPLEPLGAVGLARAALQAGDAERALEALAEAKAVVRQGQQKDPVKFALKNHARIPGLWASALLKRADYAEAETLILELLKDFPQDRSLWLDLAFAQFQQGEFQQEKLTLAVTSARKVLALDPDDRTAWQVLARAQAGLGNQAAAQEANRIFDALREDPSVQGLRARYLEKHPEEAHEVQEKHDHTIPDPTIGGTLNPTPIQLRTQGS